MSHLKERKEKICLNCQAELHGRFCHGCGQENIEPKESFWHLTKHFFYDLTHFDGKFFETLKTLLFRPGLLPKEYMLGKRASYLNPIRMYIFTSAVFFIIFFSIVPTEKIGFNLNPDNEDIVEAIAELSVELKDSIPSILDSSKKNKYQQYLSIIQSDLDSLKKDSTYINRLQSINTVLKDPEFKIKVSLNQVLDSDSAENKFKPQKNDNWLNKAFKKRMHSINKKYEGDTAAMIKEFNRIFVHNLPQLLILSLPFFALFFKLLYIRRKQFYYVDHAIFLVNLYIAVFVIMIIIFSMNILAARAGWHWLYFLRGLLIFGIFLYFYLAMKHFYKQGWLKTFFKYLLLNFLNLILMAFLLIAFLFVSIFEL